MSNLKVHYPKGAWGLPSLSPFCLKLESFLRMGKIPHEVISVTVPVGAPKGKVPWIDLDGTKLGDSTFIIHHLQSHYGVNPDSGLTAEQLAQSLTIQRLVEESLYWALVYDRWVRPENWKIYRSTLLANLPALARIFLAAIARHRLKRQLKAQGMGLHSADEIRAIGERDIAALAALLGDKPFFHGETPSNVDACVYGTLANIYRVELTSPLKVCIEGQANLVAFIERFANRYFPLAP